MEEQICSDCREIREQVFNDLLAHGMEYSDRIDSKPAAYDIQEAVLSAHLYRATNGKPLSREDLENWFSAVFKIIADISLQITNEAHLLELARFTLATDQLLEYHEENFNDLNAES